MHSDISQEIQQQFEIAFNRIETSGVTGYESVKSNIAEFLEFCFGGIVPFVILQQKIIAIKKELQLIDSMGNHGYLYLAYESAKKKEQDIGGAPLQGDRIAPGRLSLVTTLQGKAKIMEAVKEPEKAPMTIYELVESYDLSNVASEITDDKISTISRKARSIVKTLAENIEKSDFDRAMVHMAKRIKNVLNEVQLAPNIATKKEDVFGYDKMFFNKNIKHIKENGVQFRIEPTTKMHDLGKIGDIHLKSIDGTNGENYIMSHDDTGSIHHVLKIHRPDGFHKDTLVTNVAVSNPTVNSPIKMHDIYHHLVKHGMTLMSDKEQSEGGLGIWKKLARNPDTNVYAWNTETDKPVNTDRYLRDTSDTHAEYADDHENAYDVMRNTRLIATKKSLSEETLNEIYLLHSDKSQKFEDDPFYGQSTINDARSYQGHFAKETDLGKVGPLNVSQFEEQTRSGPRGRIMSHDDSGVIHHVLTYDKPYEGSPNTIKVRSITANDKHKVIGAHELLNHLMDQGHTIESGHDVTMGGLKVWNKLASMPGVNTHGWDGQNNLPIKPDKILNPLTDIPEHAVLVAHK